jgi:hypothetical protein
MGNDFLRRLWLGGGLLVTLTGIASGAPEQTPPLPTTPSWQIGGGQSGARLGSASGDPHVSAAAVASAGDVNGDGYDDIIVGAPGYNSPASPQPHEGRALVFLGSAEGPATRPVWTAEGAYDGFGSAVASAGDVDGDGYDDIIVGEPGFVAAHDVDGAAYLYAGSSSGPSPTPRWTAHLPFAALNYKFGASVASAGDVNADGYDDVLVGAPNDNGYGSRVFLYLGSSGGLSAVPAWSIQGLVSSGRTFGSTLAGAGDVNGDGYDDVLIGEPDYSAPDCYRGRVELYYGSASGLSSTPDWTYVPQLNCDFQRASAGCSLSAGNFDGDQYSDILIGCNYPGSPFFRGSASGPVSTSWYRAGAQSKNAGDVNGDGYDDVLAVSITNYNQTTGTVTIYPGGASGLASSSIWSAAIPQSETDRISIAGAGDTDGDHLANVLVGNGSLDFAETDDGIASLYFGPEVVTHPPDAAIAAPASVECDRPRAGRTTFDGAVSTDPDSTPGTHDDIVSFAWFENTATGLQPLGSGETLTVDLPLGAHTFTLKVKDWTGYIDATTATMSVVDTTAPSLTVQVDPAILWPPNHGLVPVFFPWTTTDLCQPTPIAVELVSTASNEPDDAIGDFDGATTSDIQGDEPGTSDRDLFLRVERDRRGTGRTYTATYRARDASGNTTMASATAGVPLDQGSGPEPLLLQVQLDSPGSTRVRVTWPAVPGASGYDVVTGDLRGWSVVDGVLDVGPAVVLERSTTATEVAEPADTLPPLPGSVFFYLVQQRMSDVGVGYGTESAPWPRAVTACDGGCP